jgi:hypothetical protein
MALSPAQIAQFVDQGLVRLDDAFPRDVADAGRAILWRDTGCAADDPSTWKAPVVRLGGYLDPPFREAASTPRLHAALDQLVGAGAWMPPHGLDLPGPLPARRRAGRHRLAYRRQFLRRRRRSRGLLRLSHQPPLARSRAPDAVPVLRRRR